MKHISITIVMFLSLTLQLYSQTNVVNDNNLTVKILYKKNSQIFYDLKIIVKNNSKSNHIYIPARAIKPYKKNDTTYINNSNLYVGDYIELDLLNPSDSIVFNFIDHTFNKTLFLDISIYYMLIESDTPDSMLNDLRDTNNRFKIKIYSDINTFIQINSHLLHILL